MIATMAWRGSVWRLVVALIAISAAARSAESGNDGATEGTTRAAQGDAEPVVDLDRLLRLPDSYVADGERRSGASRSEWRARFFEAREQLDELRDEIDRLQAKMEGLAGDSGTWAAGAPGLGAPDPKNSTLSYKLRQEIRRTREEIDEAERMLRDLRVQADLADVPEAWRE